MANPNKPMGLVPVQYMDGSPWNGGTRTYFIPSTDTNAYAIGDPVVSNGSGDANGVPGVILATAGFGNSVRGVIVGFGTREGLMADPANLDSMIIPATKTKNYYVMVADDPNILFEIQESAGTLLTTDIGSNADLLAGTNSGYASGWTLNSASANVGATRQLKLVGLARKADNTFGLYAKWLVRINNHELSGGTTGV